MSILLYESYASNFGIRDLLARAHVLVRRLDPGGYAAAVAEAARLEKELGIPMVVEALKPVHFGWGTYKLPVGDTYINLRSNVRFYPVGIFSTDEDFTELAWWRGGKVEYMATWPVYYVHLMKEKSATMTPQPRFAESFTMSVTSKTAKANVNAWIIGYVVLPRSMRESRITR